jgi:exonuclease III
MDSASVSYNFLSWNVRGLVDNHKCDIIKNSLSRNHFDLILLQRTKLFHIDQFKSATFLANWLQHYIELNATNASRGLLSAWDNSKWQLISSVSKTYSLFIQLESQSNATKVWISNIYGPNLDEERPIFFQELESLAGLTQGPWILAGDFNCVRNPLERSSLHMGPNESLFNSLIWDLSLQELPLLDRVFTWSNMQSSLILSKLDRILINAHWDDQLPNTSVSSLPRTTSDHQHTETCSIQILQQLGSQKRIQRFSGLLLEYLSSPRGCSWLHRS